MLTLALIAAIVGFMPCILITAAFESVGRPISSARRQLACGKVGRATDPGLVREEFRMRPALPWLPTEGNGSAQMHGLQCRTKAGGRRADRRALRDQVL